MARLDQHHRQRRAAIAPAEQPDQSIAALLPRVRPIRIARDFSQQIWNPSAMTKTRLAAALFLLCFALPLRLVQAQQTNANAPVYLFSTFKEGEQDGLRFAF